MQNMTELTINTKKKREIVDITDKVQAALKVNEGTVNIFITHTTAAVTTADLDPGGTAQDYLDAFENMIPQLQFRHPHDPAHMPDHILSTLIGTSLTVPVQNGTLVLGSWQRIVLVELDGPRERTVIVS